MIITVDPRSAVPPYEQVRDQVARMIGAGTLAPGARLPTIKQLAADLRLAPNTVARAYRELEHDGFVRSHRRRGTFVRDDVPPVAVEERDARLEKAVEQFALQLRQLGSDPDDAIEKVRAILSRV